MSDEEPIIRVRGLRNQFGSQVVHENLDLDVKRGEVLGIVGGSGTGKSVLLRSIVGLQRPTAGTVTVLGRTISEMDEEERKRLALEHAALKEEEAALAREKGWTDEDEA